METETNHAERVRSTSGKGATANRALVCICSEPSGGTGGVSVGLADSEKECFRDMT